MPRPKDRSGLAAGLAIATLASCGGLPLTANDDAFCERAIHQPGSVEVFAWLKDPHGGRKRFGEWSTDEGLAFAHELDARGVKAMTAVGIRKFPGAEPFEDASGLVVELPDELPKRLSVFKLYAAQVRREGYEPQADTGQKYLFLPWEK